MSKRKRDDCEITKMPLFKRKRVNKTPKITDEPTPETIVTVEQGSEEAVVEEQVEDTEVPTDQRVANLKGGADPITEVSTEESRADFKGAPIPTDNPKANFKGAPIPTEPSGPNIEGPTGLNIERVPWAHFETKKAAIPGEVRRKRKQRERHYKYTRTRHKLASSCKRCVGISFPTIYNDRARSRRMRRDGKRRQQSHIRGSTNHW